MKTIYLPIVIIIFGATFYQIAQKSIPKNINPFTALIIAYTFGVAACFLLSKLIAFDQPLIKSFQEVNWAVIGVGIGAVMIELGFLLAYRAGGNISLISLIISICGSLILVPIGIFFFKETITAWNALGIFLCIIGLCLILIK